MIGHVKCGACTDAIQFIKAGLESDSTEDAISDKVHKICSNAPPMLAEPCGTISNKIGPQIYDLLTGNIDGLALLWGCVRQYEHHTIWFTLFGNGQ